MYTKSKTKVEDQQEAFKKKVMAAKKPEPKNDKSSLSNIKEQPDKNAKPAANNNADGKNKQNDKNQAGGNQQASNKNRSDSIEGKNKKEKKKRIVYVEENSDDTEEEIVIVKKKKDKRNESLDNAKRGRSPQNETLDDKNKGAKNTKGHPKKENDIILKNIMRTRSQPPVEKKVEEPKKPKDPYILVTEFYLGQYKAPICGADIFDMFGWKGQYAHLDINHAYFHWLFPHFQGPFGKERAKLFRENAVIGNRIIESYRLILDFYGMQLDDEVSGKVSRADNSLDRYRETFLKPYTNHEFRVKRMLQFLNVTGYRIYALELVKFLEKEIFKVGKNFAPPLKSLESIFQTEWKPYGEVDSKDKKALDTLASKCLFTYEVLTEEINSHLKTLM